jgi:hypothetical protein
VIANIVLDSSPLGLLLQKPGYNRTNLCRDWLVVATSNAKHLGLLVPARDWTEI